LESSLKPMICLRGRYLTPFDTIESGQDTKRGDILLLDTSCIEVRNGTEYGSFYTTEGIYVGKYEIKRFKECANLI
jgi:hypothetical protein